MGNFGTFELIILGALVLGMLIVAAAFVTLIIWLAKGRAKGSDNDGNSNR